MSYTYPEALPFWLFKEGGTKSVQVVFTGIEAVMVLTLLLVK